MINLRFLLQREFNDSLSFLILEATNCAFNEYIIKSETMFKKRYLVLFSIFCGIALQSCFKVEETIASVTVRNEAGTPVPGAAVRLHFEGNNNPRFDTTKVTNGSGIASFNFSDFYEAGQSGFAVLDIDVEKGTLLGSGIIKIEEQKTTSETVVVE